MEIYEEVAEGHIVLAIGALHKMLELFGFAYVALVEGFADSGEVLGCVGDVGGGVGLTAPEGYVVEGYARGGGVAVDYTALGGVADYECLFEEVGRAVEVEGEGGGLCWE